MGHVFKLFSPILLGAVVGVVLMALTQTNEYLLIFPAGLGVNMLTLCKRWLD